MRFCAYFSWCTTVYLIQYRLFFEISKIQSISPPVLAGWEHAIACTARAMEKCRDGGLKG